MSIPAGPTSPPPPAPPTLFIVSLLVPASVLGTLTRIGLSALLDFDGATLQPPVIWAQIVGCAVFGGLLQNKASFDAVVLRLRAPSSPSRRRGAGTQRPANAHDVRLGAALYTALTSGFCGSLTTFSTWILDVFLAWANYDGVPRGAGKSFLAGLTQSFITLLASMAALRLGMKLAESGEPFCLEWVVRRLPPSWKAKPQASPTEVHTLDGADPDFQTDVQRTLHDLNALALPEYRKQRISVQLALYVGTAAFATALMAMLSLLAALYEPTRPTSLALVFSPPGAILRWYLSRFNGRSLRRAGTGADADAARCRPRLGASAPGFPLGTLAANLLGVLVLCGTYTALHASGTPPAQTAPLPRLTCDVVGSGLETGFSGALSTISTFVAELYTLGAGLNTRRGAVVYAAASWSSSLAAAALLIGVPVGSLHYVNRCTQ